MFRSVLSWPEMCRISLERDQDKKLWIHSSQRQKKKNHYKKPIHDRIAKAKQYILILTLLFFFNDKIQEML